jgi:hypothetical protein
MGPLTAAGGSLKHPTHPIRPGMASHFVVRRLSLKCRCGSCVGGNRCRCDREPRDPTNGLTRWQGTGLSGSPGLVVDEVLRGSGDGTAGSNRGVLAGGEPPMAVTADEHVHGHLGKWLIGIGGEW